MFDHFRSFPSVCQKPGCDVVVVGEDVWCDWCEDALCRDHYDAKAHGCRYTNVDKKPSKSLLNCLRNLDAGAIKAKAESLRPGYTCVVDIPLDGSALAGAYNVHVGITFEDCEEWLMRTPYCDGPSPPVEILSRIYESEAVTLRELLSRGVLVPAVYDWGEEMLSKDKDTLIVYTFFEKVRGRPLNNLAPADVKRIYIDNYAKQCILLSSLKFNAIGSLGEGEDGVFVGDVVNTRVGLSPVAPYFGGPFTSISQYYLHNIDNVLKAIVEGTIYRDRPMFEYLAHLQVKKWIIEEAQYLDNEDDEFYLWHPDSHSDNMMVGDDHRMTAMIDWQGAITMPKAVAFGGPEWMWSTDRLWNLSNEYSHDEYLLSWIYLQLGRDDLSRCAENGRKHHRLNCFIGGGLGYKASRFEQLRCVESSVHKSTLDHPEDSEATWLARNLHENWNDPYIFELFRLEDIKERGRQPQRRYRFITGTALQAMLGGVQYIRHQVQNVFQKVKAALTGQQGPV